MSTTLRGSWKGIRRSAWKEIRRDIWKRVRSGVISSGGYFKRALPNIIRTSKRRLWPFPRRPSLSIELGIVQVRGPEPWLKPKDLDTIRTTNANDARCVSWILRNITDPEALNAAIRLAGTIRWFEDGIDVDLPDDSIVSTFEVCFDSSQKLYPESRDVAYYSGRWYESTVLRGADPRNLQPCSLSPAQHTKNQALIPTSDTFFSSIRLAGLRI